MSQPEAPTESSAKGAPRDVCKVLEHTLLASMATPAQIDMLCDEAAAFGLFAVCVNPVFVARSKARLAGTGVSVVTVAGFPLASTFLEVIVQETELAVRAGADEIDTVMRLGAAKAGDWGLVERDARAVVRAAGDRPVKLILETSTLDEVEIERACSAALAAGVRFVKTSTGYAGGGATVEAVAQLRRCVGSHAGVKASGGIRTAAETLSMMAAGADRVGTSAGAAIARELLGNT